MNLQVDVTLFFVCLLNLSERMCQNEAKCAQSGDTLISDYLGEVLAVLACVKVSVGDTHSLREQSDSCFASGLMLI